MDKQHVDGLTQLKDRVALEEDLDEMIQAQKSVAMALLDVDHFKTFNTTLGHAKGDEILQIVVNAMNEAEDGIPYRTSGDEFAILFPGTSLEAAFLRCEELRKSVADAASHPDYAGLPSQLSVSVGVAQYPRDAKDSQSLMKEAESALWACKEAGRNRVGLPVAEEMVLKSCQYSSGSLRRLKLLAEKTGQTESTLLREALADLLQKYDE